MSREIIEQHTRQYGGSLMERLKDIHRRVGKMCSEGKPPHMTIPARWDDDDMFISVTVDDAISALTDHEAAMKEKEREIDTARKVISDMNETETNVRNILRPLMDVNGDSHGIPSLETLVTDLRAKLAAAKYLLKELHATVWGECPSLLDEDSGGNAILDLKIEEALKEADHADK